jgi:carboxyl-terminal processing protease
MNRLATAIGAGAERPSSPRHGRPGGPRWISGLVLGTVLFLSACAAPIESTSKFNALRVERVFADGYANVQEKYIDPVDIAELTFRGVRNLDEIDPILEIARTEKGIRISHGDSVAPESPSPAGREPHAWARFTTRAVLAARGLSQAVQAAGSEEIFAAVFNGALLPLDHHSRYDGLRSARDSRAQREGFGGIGIRLNFDGALPKIVAVHADTPASLSPLKAGDVITHIDGLPIEGLTRHDVIWSLRGLEGTLVSLTVTREDSSDPISATLKRALIFPQTVEFERKGRVAVIRITSFNQRTARDFEEIITDLTQAPADRAEGIVLDLRGNPGGLLDQAVAVADVFLRSGVILTTGGRHPESVQRFNATGRDLTDGVPVVVLINGGSASAAEIVASALQDRGRAVVVGTNSYGKGTVQNISRLPNDGELILTWSRFRAPSGYILDQLGVFPNVCTSDTLALTVDKNLHEQVQHSVSRAATTLTLWRTLSRIDESRRREIREVCPDDMDKPEIDLKVAQEILADRTLYARMLGMSSPKLATEKNSRPVSNLKRVPPSP